jgi:hypothetical protein
MARKDEIIADLKEFYDSDTTRTKIGRVREIYDVIEELRDGGMSLSNILEILNKKGFELKLQTLTSYLHTIKNERGAERRIGDKQKKPFAAKDGRKIVAKTKTPAVATPEKVKVPSKEEMIKMDGLVSAGKGYKPPKKK